MDLKDFIKNNWNNFFDSRDEADAFYKRIGVLHFLLLDRIYKEYYKKQCDIPVVSQQRELLLAYNEEVNQCMVDSQDILNESDVDEFIANNCS